MGQDETQSTTPHRQDDGVSAEPGPEADVTAAEEPEGTVGMGTSLALGCVAGTILLIVIGLIYLGLTALL